MFKIIYIFFIFLNTCFAVNIDTSKPIKIESNEIKINKNDNIIIFKGKVKSVQDTMVMFTDKMFVFYNSNKENKINIKTIKAYGNVDLKNKNMFASGDKAEYNVDKNIITLEGNVILTEEDTVVYGEKMIYNLLTGESNMYGLRDKNRITIIIDDINNLKERYDK